MFSFEKNIFSHQIFIEKNISTCKIEKKKNKEADRTIFS
jgi:hypothetical protein